MLTPTTAARDGQLRATRAAAGAAASMATDTPSPTRRPVRNRPAAGESATGDLSWPRMLAASPRTACQPVPRGGRSPGT